MHNHSARSSRKKLPNFMLFLNYRVEFCVFLVVRVTEIVDLPLHIKRIELQYIIVKKSACMSTCADSRDTSSEARPNC